MALWHIPLFHERNPLDTIFDDIFDLSSPPRFYRRLYLPYHKHHQKSDVRSEKSSEESFKVSLDAREYKPENITLKVDGEKLIVTGKRYRENDYGFERSEFERAYPIPSDVDVEGFKSTISDDGLLEIKAPKIKQEQIHGTVKPIQEGENDFKAIFNVSEYKPDEVSVKVQGNRVIVHGEQKSESKEDEKVLLVNHKQFMRQFVLPETVKVDSLHSKWTKDGKLVIEAEKIPPIEAEGKQLTIEDESEDGSKNKQK